VTTPRQTSGKLLALGVPLAIGFVSQMAISFTDAALIARLSAAELAGTTLALSRVRRVRGTSRACRRR